MQICTGDFFMDLLLLIIVLAFANGLGMHYERYLWRIGRRRKEMEDLLRQWKEMGI